jgi:hypothetical protein
MERPLSLYGYMEQTGLPESEALLEWELLVLAFQNHVKEQKNEHLIT